MRTAANVLWVIQALAIIGCIITGKEFIDFSSGPALFKTIGFFLPAILAAIFECIADNKSKKNGETASKPPEHAAQPAPEKQSAEAMEAEKLLAEAMAAIANDAAAQPTIHPSIQYCPKCGTKQSSENGFCVSCGNKLG